MTVGIGGEIWRANKKWRMDLGTFEVHDAHEFIDLRQDPDIAYPRNNPLG